MVITQEFGYVRPQTLDEVLAVLADTADVVVLNGGTDLIVKIKDGGGHPTLVVDIKGLTDLHKLELGSDGSLHIGALVTFSELISSDVVREHFPVLWEAATTVASVGVRNRATLVGNICSAVPSLDSGPALLVYEAVVHVTGRKGSRTVPINEWFTGPKRTALDHGELVTHVTLPPASPSDLSCGGCYVKLGRYRGEDLAQSGVAVLAYPNKRYRVAFCAVGPVAKRSPKLEEFLTGKEPTKEVLEEAKKLVLGEISPISDVRASKEYRQHATQVMLGRAVLAAHVRLEYKDVGAIWV